MVAVILFATVSIQSAIHAAFPVGTIATPVTRGDLTIVRVDVVTDGGRMKRDLLLQRFPFGWQMIKFGSPKLLPCELKARGAGDSAVAFFSNSIGLGNDTSEYCSAPPQDEGPESDVIAVRSLMERKEMTPAVRVVGNYAVGSWYGWGGGETVFAKKQGEWKRAGGGGGAFSAQDLTSLYGVPPAIAAKLASPDDRSQPTTRFKSLSAT